MALLSRQFAQTGKEATVLQGNLNKIKLLGMSGAALGTAGFMGLALMAKAAKSAEAYAHQLNIINMAGWKQKDIADAVGDAWKNTSQVITTTATDNLRTLLDMKNVLGTMSEARMALPIVSRIQAVLAASSDGKISGHSQDMAYSMAKALDIIGAAQNKDSFQSQAEMMTKVIIATQGRVSPESYKSVFQYARQARYGLSDEFKYQILPTLMMENSGSGGGGGGSRGVGPMLAAFYRITNQGYVNQKAIPELAKLGLINPNSALSTTTSGTTVGAFKGADLAAKDPFQFVQNILLPAIHKVYGKNASSAVIQKTINSIFRGNSLAASLALEFALKPSNFRRDQRNIINTMSIADAYNSAISKDPNTAKTALGAQWENFKTAVMMTVVPVIVPALIKLTHWLNTFSQWARTHQDTIKKLVIGFGLLFAALAIGGVILIVTAGIAGLGAALGVIMDPVTWVIAGFAAIYYGLKKLSDWMGSSDNWFAKSLRWLDKGSTKAVPPDDLTKGAPFDPIAISGQKSIVIHNHTHLDGKEVARSVTTHQANAASRPQWGTSLFDLNMAPMPSG